MRSFAVGGFSKKEMLYRLERGAKKLTVNLTVWLILWRVLNPDILLEHSKETGQKSKLLWSGIVVWYHSNLKRTKWAILQPQTNKPHTLRFLITVQRVFPPYRFFPHDSAGNYRLIRRLVYSLQTLGWNTPNSQNTLYRCVSTKYWYYLLFGMLVRFNLL